ncbi:MAG: GNAT family N-acetyltransferase [Planctomycetota bacterium]
MEKLLELGIRELREEDLEDVVRIDALHTGRRKLRYWRRVFRKFHDSGSGRIGLAANDDGRVIGYLFGEIRAFEFGSDPCGWVFAVGVDPRSLRANVASALLDEACRRFLEAGVKKVRTMVRRNDVPVMAFFRSQKFVGGPFVQLERDLKD